MTDRSVTDEGLLTSMTAEIVAAYVGHNPVPVTDLSGLIGDVHAALHRVTGTADPEPEPLVPAVSPRRSVTPDAIICLEDGKKFKSLKRHLMTHHNLTPDEYRAKWGLARDYPMVAPNYSAARSAMAKDMELGRKRKAAPAAPAKGRAAAGGKAAGARRKAK